MKFKLRYIPLIILALLLVTVGILLKTGGLETIIDRIMDSKEPKEITDPAEEETFAFPGVSITLPGDFAWSTNKKYIANEEYYVSRISVSKSDITPNEGYAFPTLQEYMKVMLPTWLYVENDEAITFDIKDEILYADCQCKASGTPDYIPFQVEETGEKQCIVMFETDGAFWAFSFYSPTQDYETVKAQALEWAKTITFKN